MMIAVHIEANRNEPFVRLPKGRSCEHTFAEYFDTKNFQPVVTNLLILFITFLSLAGNHEVGYLRYFEYLTI